MSAAAWLSFESAPAAVVDVPSIRVSWALRNWLAAWSYWAGTPCAGTGVTALLMAARPVPIAFVAVTMKV